LNVSGKVLILGCGNVLLGDDGFGPAVARRCRRFRLGESIIALDIGTSLGSFLMEMAYGGRRPKALVIVDAADGGRRPGEVFVVRLADLESRATDTFGLHDFPSVSVFRELEASKGIRIEILACQPCGGMDVVRIGLSEEVEDAVPVCARMAVRRARSLLALSLSQAKPP